MRALSYCPITGVFTWKDCGRNKHLVGRSAGSVDFNGYIRIMINNKACAAHRMAWLYCYGFLPRNPYEIDHINGIKSDNRLSNLRLATHSYNMANTELRSTNTSGKKGVCWHKQGKKWIAQITVNSKRIYLGLFDTIEEAHATYCHAAKEHFGQFARVDAKHHGVGTVLPALY